jgi:hypothetical protein
MSRCGLLLLAVLATYSASIRGLTAGPSEIIGHRRGRVIHIDGADSFFSRLQQRVELAEQAREQGLPARSSGVRIEIVVVSILELGRDAAARSTTA